MLFEFSLIGQIFQYLGQRHNTHHRHGEIALDFLDRRQLALAALLTVQGDQHTGRLRALGLDDLHHFADRRASSNHVVNDQHPAFQRRAHQTAAFAMGLGFLAVEAPGQVQLMLLGQRHGRRCRQRDALVGGAKQHIEDNAALDYRCGVEAPQLGQRQTTVEQPGIEEVRAGAPGLEGEGTKAQDSTLDGKTNELALVSLHEENPG